VSARRAAAAVLLSSALGARPAHAHRLDEYLQATTLSVARDRVRGQLRLAPGVAVAPDVLAHIDSNADGVLSASEQRAYAERALADLSLAVDGARVRPRLVAWRYADVAQMRDGMGEIVIDFEGDVPPGGGGRRLTFENRHLPRISVYLVNALVPADTAIEITAQRRNYTQSSYRLDYEQGGPGPGLLTLAGWTGPRAWLGAALLSLGGLGLLSLGRIQRARHARACIG
jgi:hypothetical protein